MQAGKRRPSTELDCQRCREREEIRAAMPKSLDPVFINARRGVPKSKDRAIEIGSQFITLVRLQVEDKLGEMSARGENRYTGVDLAQVENDLQESVEREIRTAITRGNERSVLDGRRALPRLPPAEVRHGENQLAGVESTS